jgi:pimeloyl-ACP methyl ester carboxylesterase
MSEQFARVGQIDLCYETFGSPADPTVLLVMGLGTQMIAWPVEFCEQIVARGFHVVRFDNRDNGLSTKFDGHPPPTSWEILTRRPRNPAYTLEDMAQDAVGLLDHLGVERAHVTGASMGGMIAQTIAAHHPGRVASLVSIMSTTGNWRVGVPAARAYPYLLAKGAHTREIYQERGVKLFRLVGSQPPTFPYDDDRVRELAGISWDRSRSFAGTGRQLAAILASGDRTPDLGRITAPTLVIHGTKDRLVGPSGGRATAKAIRGARMLSIDGMGHDLPRGAWPRITDAIVENATLADRGGVRSGAA